MAKVCPLLTEKQQQQEQQYSTTAPTPSHRRPRVREVSSRFMSPMATSSSTCGDLLHLASPKGSVLASTELHSNRSQSVQRRRQPVESESPLRCAANENRLEMARSLETPLGAHSNKHLILFSTQRKSHRSSVKLFKDNEEQQRPLSDASNNSSKFPVRSSDSNFPLPSRYSRPETTSTTTAAAAATPRTNPSSSSLTTTNKDILSSVLPTAAAKLVRLTVVPRRRGSPLDSDSYHKNPTHTDSSEETMGSEDATCCCSGNEDGADSSNFSASPCNYQYHPSFNSPLPSCEPSFSYPAKSLHKPLSLHCKPHQKSSLRLAGGTCLPPHPSTSSTTTKFGVEARKGRKASSSNLDDVHALRLLHNRYMQWRYANAKSEAAMSVQLQVSERSLFALLAKESELHDCVKRKRIELGLLKKKMTLLTLVEAQMPYLDDWANLESEYSSSISDAIKALQNASLQLPITGNVRANIEEIKESLKIASNVMEFLSFPLDRSFPKAEKMDNLISTLAETVTEERALIEECGDLLCKMHILQVEECSLRGQVIQLKQRSSCQEND